MIKKISLCVIAFLAGITVGLSANIYKRNPQKTIETTKTAQIQNIDDKQLIHQQDKKVSNLSQQSNYIEKSFNKQGILVHETIHFNSSSNISDSVSNTQEKDETQTQIQTVMETKTVTQYQSNLLFGINLNPIQYRKLDKINLMATYRIFGNINLFAETNYKFQTQIGILFPID